MKILLINNTMPYRGSGSGLTEYAYQLARHLKPLLSESDSIGVLYALSKSERNNVRGLLISNTSFKRRIASIPTQEYDIIHILDHELGFAAKILKKFGNKARVLTTIHDLSRFEKGLHRGLAQMIYNHMVQGSVSDAVGYSDFLLCNSTQTCATIIAHFGQRASVKVVSHGTNDAIISTPLQKKKENGYFTTGYIGALMKHKNVLFILQAAKALESKPEYRFAIYGTGADKGILDKFRQDNALGNVKLRGHLDEDAKIKAYDSFNAFAFPSLYEGLGYPILEAQARGLPVIIYKYGKIPKEVRKYCFEAESPERMAQIIENLKKKGYKEKLRKAATEYARSFTWERCARETFVVYKKVLIANRKSNNTTHY